MIKINSKVNKPTKSRWYQRAIHRIAAWMLFMVDVYIPKEFDDMSLWERQRQAKGIPIMRCYSYDPKHMVYERDYRAEDRLFKRYRRPRKVSIPEYTWGSWTMETVE